MLHFIVTISCFVKTHFTRRLIDIFNLLLDMNIKGILKPLCVFKVCFISM